MTALQRTNTIAQSFIENYLNASNAASGPVKIKYVGGQEVVPPRKAGERAQARPVRHAELSDGVLHRDGAGGLRAARRQPGAARAAQANGAWEILQEVYMKKAGAHLLAWGESMTSYNTYHDGDAQIQAPTACPI